MQSFQNSTPVPVGDKAGVTSQMLSTASVELSIRCMLMNRPCTGTSHTTIFEGPAFSELLTYLQRVFFAMLAVLVGSTSPTRISRAC